jgi:hypothetical protein
MTNCCFLLTASVIAAAARRWQARRIKVQRRVTRTRAAGERGAAGKATVVTRIAISSCIKSFLNYRGFQIEMLLTDER